MIVAAAICPSPPLLAGALTGQERVLPALSAACAAAVARLLAAAPDVVAVAGPAAATGPWDPAGALSLASFAPALRTGARRPPGRLALDNSALDNAAWDNAAWDNSAWDNSAWDNSAWDNSAWDNSKKRDAGRPVDAPALPLSLGIGALLLDEAGYRGPRVLQAIAGYEPPAGCLAVGREIAASAPRVALLAVGDGSARRSASAPGYLDERAAPFDEAVERAVREGDLPALAALDPALAAELLAAGRPAWQALAGALDASGPPADRPPADGRGAVGRLRAEILYSGAPLGVAYLVATLIPR